jgi:cell division protein FtsW (lipid II flippase)
VPTLFHAGQVALLLLLALGLVVRQRRAGGPLAIGWQVLLAVGVIAWGGATLAAIAGDHGPAIEVEGYVLRPPPSGAVTLGTSAVADVPLFDKHAAPVHAVITWRDNGNADPVPVLWNASAEHRLEIDGEDSSSIELTTRTEVIIGGRTLEVMAGGPWPGVSLIDDKGQIHRLRAGIARGALALLPGVGNKVRTRLAWLQEGPDGVGYRMLESAPLPGSGPAAVFATKGSVASLTFASPADRAGHTVIVDRPGDPPVHPGDHAVPLESGQVVTMGYTRFVVDVQRGGVVSLRSVGPLSRMPWPTQSRLLDSGAGLLLAATTDDGSLTVASLDPDRKRGFRRVEGRVIEGEGGARRVAVSPNQRIELPVGPGARASLRIGAATTPRAVVAGLASNLDQSTWMGLVILGGLYLLLTVLASMLGVLHSRTGAIFHGAAMLFVLGLACLYRLAEPGDSLRAGWALRQVELGTAAVGAAVLGSLVLGGVAWLRVRRGLRPLRGDGIFRWLDGPAGDGSRSRWLYAVAVLGLAAQLPFGEAGIALPGIGSVQPIELVRGLLVVYLAYWTSRALEAKQARIRGPEGLSARWAYMAHAIPILVVLVLCYGLHDISPILVFVVFLAVFYALSLMRPSLKLWPMSALREHLAVDVLLVGGVLLVAGFLLLGDPDGTVARRIQVWWDPWNQTAEAYQSMTALWASASGGIWGQGWTGANGVLPPAVRDDFILALLAARGGAVAVTLVAVNFGLMLAAGAASIRRDGSPAGAEGRALLAGGMLWMLVIQAGVVLGSATGGLPVMGQPLPFVAAAGSHLLLFCVPAVATVLWCTRVPLASERPHVRVTERPPVNPIELPDVPEPGLPFPDRLPEAPRPSLGVPGLPLAPLSASPTTEIPRSGPTTEGAA